MKSKRTIQREMARLAAIRRSEHGTVIALTAAYEALSALRWAIDTKSSTMTPSDRIKVLYQSMETELLASVNGREDGSVAEANRLHNEVE